MLKPLFAAMCLSLGASAMPLASAAHAQTTPGSISKSEFVRMAGSGDMYEIESSKLALSKASDPSVKKVAQMIIDDHTASSKKLLSAANEKAPPSMDKKHADMLQKLKAANGKDMTQLYVSQQIQAHKEAIDLFERYAKNGDDPKLKSFASETLPTLRSHLQEVQKLQKA